MLVATVGDGYVAPAGTTSRESRGEDEASVEFTIEYYLEMTRE